MCLVVAINVVTFIFVYFSIENDKIKLRDFQIEIEFTISPRRLSYAPGLVFSFRCFFLSFDAAHFRFNFKREI